MSSRDRAQVDILVPRVWPDERASSIAISATGSALAAQGHTVTVHACRPSGALIATQVSVSYPIPEWLDKKLAWLISLRPPLGPLGFAARRLLFAALYALRAKSSDALAWTRDARIAGWLGILSRTVVLEVHNPWTRGERRIVGAAVHRNLSIRIAAISRPLEELIRECLGEDVPITYAPSAVGNPAAYEEAEATLVAEDLPGTFRILYVGRSESVGQPKGIELLAAAAAHPSLNPRVVLVLVGARLDGQEVHSSSRSALDGRLVQLPSVASSDVPALLKGADALIAIYSRSSDLSLTSASPLKVVEYALSGTPIIASRTKNVVEILGDDAALYFEPDDVDSLVRTINWTVENYAAAEEIAEAARDRARTRTQERRVAKIMAGIGIGVPTDEKSGLKRWCGRRDC